MKRLIGSTVAVFAVILGAGSLSAQSQDMVFINSQRLMAEAPSVQSARESMQQEMQRMEQQIVPLRDEYEQMLEDFQAQQGTMAGETRRQREQELMAKQQEIQTMAAELEEEAQGRQQELLEPALDAINDVIEGIREERGYSFVLDVAAGGVITADPALDITSEVLDRLQAGNPGS